MSTKCVCNLCGKEMDYVNLNNGLKISRTMGYGSAYDGDHIDIDICCECFDKIIEACVIDPRDEQMSFDFMPSTEEYEDE